MDGFSNIHLGETILRSILSFFTILVLARFIGKKQLSQLTFFHYITGITIGSIAAEVSTQHDTDFFDGSIALICWTLLTLLVSFLTLNFSKIRILIDDRPTILIQNGTILKKSMKKARLHPDELAMLLREQGIFSFNEVHYAVFETNGELSVLKKPTFANATKEDVNTSLTLPAHLPTEIIRSGKIIRKNLKELDVTEDWVLGKLKEQNIEIDKVYFAQVLPDDSFYISLDESDED
ncbi:DUF421 domain-containing protein [Ureibacillus chungkukjangi]|uniref:Uncharacterized membrane protein YcaP (DUF421 family) n=1 Tax=Ureibacillus chungkukjangi TaxID=1202712 RepID=A0A318TTE2_9BACL|nr:DUF421 domain-containing protein [Ureibacillus chungkukjangi]MCM3390126.1 DUF421 domain-containing protein [Ureibacillus chungkukjangi]PYF06318.1 uncharacterized membrane protein YcaP (DUF421 family) [Ureibacillus chungkukjangi]